MIGLSALQPVDRMAFLSFSLSGGVLLAAAVVQWIVIARSGKIGEPAGIDLLGKTLLNLLSGSDTPLLAGLLWAFVCLSIDVAYPAWSQGSKVLDSLLQRILAVDYCILVPALVGTYMYLAQSLQALMERASGRSSRRSVAGFLFWQFLICVAVFAFQYATIKTQTSAKTATPPYLWSIPMQGQEVWPLTPQGAWHVALRALDAAMGLGLLATIVAAWLRKKHIGAQHLLEPRSLKVRADVRHFGAGIALALVLASFIVWLHFATILQHQPSPNAERSIVGQFFTSSWFVWVVFWFLAAALALDIFFDLRGRVEAELDARETDQRERLAKASGDETALQALKTEFEISSKLREEFDRNSWPVPRWFYIVIASSGVIAAPLLGLLFNSLISTSAAAPH